MMNARLSILVIISLFLSGCGSIAAPTATPILLIPTLLPPEETTATATVLTPALETGTSVPLKSTATPTLRPTGTPTLQPTDTPLPTLQMEIVFPETQLTPIPQPAACQPPPQSWVSYTVRRNDTLSSLGQRAGVSWQQIQRANCLAGTRIFAGQRLYLPFIPASLPTISAPLPTTTDLIEAPGAVGPGDGFTMAVPPGSGPPGTIFRIEVVGFEAYESVTIQIFSFSAEAIVFEKTATANDMGRLVEEYASPLDAPSGVYMVEVGLDVGFFEITGPP